MTTHSSGTRDDEIIAAYLQFEPVKELKQRFHIPNDPAFYKILDAHGIKRRRHTLSTAVMSGHGPATFELTTIVKQIVSAEDVWTVRAMAEDTPGLVEIVGLQRIH